MAHPGNRVVIEQGISADGTYPTDGTSYVGQGDVLFMFPGNLGSATVELVFVTEDPQSGTDEQQPANADMTFTGNQAPVLLLIPVNIRYRLVVSGADGSTDFSVITYNTKKYTTH